MTPNEIELAARRMLNQVGSKYWSSDEIIENYLYFAASELAQETYCIENRYTTDSVVDQSEYSRPSRAIRLIRVEYRGEKLKPISERQKDGIDLNVDTTVTGEPQYYTEFDDVIKLFPTPDTAGDQITIYSNDLPDVPEDNTTLEIPLQFHSDLVIGVCYFMSLKELGHPNTSRFEAKWEAAKIRAKQKWKLNKRGDSYQRVTREEDTPGTVLGSI